MLNIQPLQLTLLTRNYTWQKKNHLVVTSMLGFPLSGGRPLLEQDLWERLNEELGDNILDMGMPKPNGEVLLYGNYHSPNSQPVTADRIVLQCGSIDKELAVIGDRYWRMMVGPTAPEPFTSMPLSYEYAFGGKKYDKNTIGKGLETVDVFGEQRMPLPNIEYPDKLMTSEGDRPEPAGFSALDIMWQQRMQRAGTYDDKWIQEQAPAYPLDIDWNHFNAAPDDQWIDGFWQGDESFSLYNMHPEQVVIQGGLPNFRARAFLAPKGDEAPQLKEVEQRLETLFFFPEQDLGVLLWRGNIQVVEDDQTDMQALMCVFEHAESPPRPLQHYQQAYDDRQKPELALKYINNTTDLIPERVPCGYRYVTISEDDMNMPMLENMFAGAEESRKDAIEQTKQKKEEVKKQLEAMKDNMPPEDYDKKMAELNKPIDFPEFKVPSKAERLKMMDEELLTEPVDFMKLEADIKGQIVDAKEEGKNRILEQREKLKAMDMDDDQLADAVAAIDDALNNVDLPPLLPRPDIDDLRATLDEQLENIEKQKQQLLEQDQDISAIPDIDVDIDAVFAKFKQMEQMQIEGYRLSAHNDEDGRHHHIEPLSLVAQQLLLAHKNGESLRERDFACIDLSNQNLSGINLEYAYLEQANLSGAVLNDAKLKGAILARANLSGARLNNADLSNANLGKVNFNHAVLKKSNLKQAILENSEFTGASITECDLTEASITGATFFEVDFSHSTMNNFIFDEQDLSSCKFDHCQLNNASFTKCTLSQAGFSQAIMVKASFSGCHAEHTNFSQANLENARFHEECQLNHANFSDCKLEKSVFLEASLQEARFDEAQFYLADFSRSDLQRASFHRAIGKKAQFIKSDLGAAKMTSMNIMEGTLMKARLTSADFSDSNLYAVDFMNATVGGTDFSGANLDRSQLEDWNP